jgi:YVTN family beta-propeller protein
VGAATSAPVPFVVFPPNPTPLRIGVEADARHGIEAIRVTPDGTRAYITLPAANSVLAFDIAQRRVIKTIPVGLKPQGIAIEPEGRYAYVANTGGGDVTVIDIDPQSPNYHKTLPGPVHPIKVGDGPRNLVVSAFGPTVLVVNEGSGTISLIDANPNAGTFDRVTANVHVGSGGHDATVTPDGTRAYVVTEDGIVVIDVASRAVTSTIHVGSGGHDVTISPDGTVLFALSDNGLLSIIDIAPGSATFNQVVKTKPVGSGGQDVQVSPDGTLLYVTLRDLNVTQVFRIIRGAGGGGGSGVAPGDPTDLQDLATIDVGEGPLGIAILPDGSAALVVNQSSGTVSVLRADSLLTAVPVAPAAVELTLGVHPTPSLGSAAVHFSLTKRSAVEIEIFDLQGRMVKRLVGGVLEAGPHTASWNGVDRDGARVGAGIYFARMKAEGKTLHARVVWLR